MFGQRRAGIYLDDFLPDCYTAPFSIQRGVTTSADSLELASQRLSGSPYSLVRNVSLRNLSLDSQTSWERVKWRALGASILSCTTLRTLIQHLVIKIPLPSPLDGRTWPRVDDDKCLGLLAGLPGSSNLTGLDSQGVALGRNIPFAHRAQRLRQCLGRN